ncbi:MAG: hypothetical protein AB1646_20350 [Thermodesulfobacteriota bacterium]
MKRVLTVGLLLVLASFPQAWSGGPERDCPYPRTACPDEYYSEDILDIIGGILRAPCEILSACLGPCLGMAETVPSVPPGRAYRTPKKPARETGVPPREIVVQPPKPAAAAPPKQPVVTPAPPVRKQPQVVTEPPRSPKAAEPGESPQLAPPKKEPPAKKKPRKPSEYKPCVPMWPSVPCVPGR